MEVDLRTLILEADIPRLQQAIREHPELLAERNASGRTWLHFAAARSTPDVVRCLFDLGIPLNTVDPSGESPLSAAARHGDLDLVAWMLEKGADPSVSQWPMIDAVSTGSLEMIRAFVARGADHRFSFGDPTRTLIQQAEDFGHREVASFLRSLDSGPDREAQPRISGSALADFALEVVPSPPAAEMEPGERLSFADLILESDLEGIQSRLRDRPELLHARAFPMGESWLHYAASEGNAELVRFFFDQGIPLNTENESHECPLSAAIASCSDEVVRWMLDHGADPALSQSSMISAVHKGKLALVREFVERGVDYNFEFGIGPRTPLSLALMFGQTAVADYLQSLDAALPGGYGEDSGEAFDLHQEIKDYFAYHTEQEPLSSGLQEIVPGKVNVAVWTIDPGNRNDPKIIFTSGMSEAPLTVPEGFEDYRFCELVMYLPPDWPSQPDLNDSAHAWPWLWLRAIAHNTHEQETWLGDWTTTFGNGEPPRPLDPSTKFCGFILATNMGALDGFPSDDGRFINIVNVVPVYAEELALARREGGTVELLQRFEKRGIRATFRPNRPNVAADGGFFKGLFGRH